MWCQNKSQSQLNSVLQEYVKKCQKLMFFPKMKVLFLTNCQNIHFMDVSVNKMLNHKSFTVE